MQRSKPKWNRLGYHIGPATHKGQGGRFLASSTKRSRVESEALAVLLIFAFFGFLVGAYLFGWWQ